MEANELMIDDWVQIVSDAPIMANEYHRIDWIRTGEVGLDNRKIVTYPYIQPIPLTPEILEKNGFVYNAIPFVDGWEQFGLTLYRGGNGYRINCGINVSLIIDCVHELQHALRLCGIEKEIEL